MKIWLKAGVSGRAVESEYPVDLRKSASESPRINVLELLLLVVIWEVK